MNLLVVLGVLVLFSALLVVLGLWQRKIEEAERVRVVAEIRDAEERGTSQPIAQHPQIDVEACIGCGSCIEACPEEEVLGLVDGVAHVIHGSRCIGHGRCADACPVAAVKIGLGDVSMRSDIPVLRDNLETSVPGVYIAGELGGFALIRLAIEQGIRIVDELDRQLREDRSGGTTSDAVDLLIVGAGPAGFAATLKAIERGLSYATIDQEDVGGTIRKYPRRKLTLVGRLELPLYGVVKKEEFLKEELIAFWESIIEQFGLEIQSGIKLLGVERRGDLLEARTSSGSILARRVVLALGRRGTPRRLGVPGEETEKVLYQLIDTATYSREHILVVGGGDSAIEAAIGLANQSDNVVTLSYRREDFFRLKRRNEERVEQYGREGRIRLLLNSKIQSIQPDAVELICTRDGVERAMRLRNDYVFVMAGGEPPYPLLKSMGVKFGGRDEEVAPPDQPHTINLQS